MNELDKLRIRDEILQAMYWMRSEGLGTAPAASELARFLALPAAALAPCLDGLINDGLLERAAGGYALTPSGEELGKRTFAEEFADLTRPAHGECDEDCACHVSPEEAARCLEERAGHVH